MGPTRVYRLWMTTVMLVLVGIPLIEAWAASKKSPPSSDMPEVSSGRPPTAEERTLFTKGQLLFDRMCPLLLRDSHNLLQRAENFIAGRQSPTNPESLRYQEQVHREAEQAKRDLELFEIDVKARYGVKFPSWWQPYTRSKECDAVAQQLKSPQQK